MRGAITALFLSGAFAAGAVAQTGQARNRFPPADSPLTTPAPGARSPRRTIVVDVAERVSPAVVSIGAVRTSYIRESDPFGFDLYFPLYKYAKRDYPYLGSGFIIDDKGHVLTNYHVVENAASISVTLTDRRVYSATLLDADRYVDIALLQLEPAALKRNLPVLPMGDSAAILIGETVMAVGNPFGPLISDPRPSVSLGVVSAMDRSFKPTPDEQSGAPHTYRNMIQTDAAINPGNSGGPLVNLDGEAIGINTFIFSRSGESASVGFSIPINRARKIIDEILVHGRVRPIMMDFAAMNLAAVARSGSQPAGDRGALIRSVDAGSPAEKSGMKPGDVIVAADGAPVNDAEDLFGHILSRNVGDVIILRAMRDDAEIEIAYPVTEAPAEPVAGRPGR